MSARKKPAAKTMRVTLERERYLLVELESGHAYWLAPDEKKPGVGEMTLVSWPGGGGKGPRGVPTGRMTR